MREFLLLILFVLVAGLPGVRSQSYTAGTTYSSYTDIDPDTLMYYTIVPYSNNIYSFNILGDSVPDLEFTARGSVSSGGSQAFIRVRSLDPDLFIRLGRWDSVYVPGTGGWHVTKVADPLDSGEVINTLNAVWDTSEMYLTDHTSSGGGIKDVNDWIGTDKYLAFKYSNLQSENYGWMRIECPSADSCYVKEFSLTQDPLNVKGNISKRILVYPNPVTDILNFAGGSVCSFEIRNPAGKLVMNGGKNIRELYVKDLDAGFYLLQIRTESGVENFRIVKM